MRKSSNLIRILPATLAVVLFLVNTGFCQFPGLPHGQSPAPGLGCPPPACGPMSPPFLAGPCMPVQDCKGINVEGGVRAFYTRNWAKLTRQIDGDVNFVKDLNFSENTLVGEVYGALRVAPTLALTYSFLIPREDHGWGTLPADLNVNGTIFTAGTQVTAKSTTSLHRFEGEYFLFVGPNYRAGGYLLGELWVERFSMESDVASDSKTRDEFLMGGGGSGEYAPSKGIFLKFKGAYTFLQKQTGIYLDGQGRFFPELNTCGGNVGFRPYVAAGYRYRAAEWVINEDTKFQTSIHGPYAEVGLIF